MTYRRSKICKCKASPTIILSMERSKNFEWSNFVVTLKLVTSNELTLIEVKLYGSTSNEVTLIEVKLYGSTSNEVTLNEITLNGLTSNGLTSNQKFKRRDFQIRLFLGDYL